MTTFTGPLKVQGANNPTGNPQTDSTGYGLFTKVIPLTFGAGSRAVVTIPDRSILTNLEGFVTSAFAADVSACNINWGSSTDATRYGVVAVSAVGQIRNATVSAAGDFLNNSTPNTIVVTLSAVSTTTFTSGGVFALARFLMVD